MATASELPAFLQYGALGLLAAVLLGVYLLARYAMKTFGRELKGQREGVEWIGRLMVQLRADVERIRIGVERGADVTPTEVPRPTPRPFRAQPVESMTAPRADAAPPTAPGRRKLPSRRD
jgi:hypothetical protein